jgi:hypothetical protein
LNSFEGFANRLDVEVELYGFCRGMGLLNLFKMQLSLISLLLGGHQGDILTLFHFLLDMLLLFDYLKFLKLLEK